MKSEILLKIKSKLKTYLKDKEILDIILFGSAIKGKISPNDIDIAVITNKENLSIPNFHVSIIKPIDFFRNPPSLINTLLREGYSIKNNMPFSRMFKFDNQVLFTYNLSSLNNNSKVKIVNILRGKNKSLGLVKEEMGKWLGNGVFLVPITSAHLFEKFLINFKVPFTKNYILMH